MSNLASIIEKLGGHRIVVLGDLAVDCYVETRPSRLSREAPVMVLQYERRRYMPGCAANTVMNLHALGADPVPIGIVGDDEAGAALLDTFGAKGIPVSGIVASSRSVMKVRVMSGDYSRPKQQVLRMDVDPVHYGEDAMLELIARAGAAEGAEGVVVSDYGYGAASPGLLRAVLGVAEDARVSIDSRARVGEFEGADLLTPNEWEASEFLSRRVETDAEAEEAACDVRTRTGAGAVLLTRGNRGMVLADGKAHVLPIAGSREIVDPSGAGDTVVAAATLARVCGASYLDAAHLANLAAGITVMKSGAVPVTAHELKRAVEIG